MNRRKCSCFLFEIGYAAKGTNNLNIVVGRWVRVKNELAEAVRL
ncbi:MAG: hypothetical protein JWO42_3184, partial [Chloroflexi bacterium]|nr:hypothetical protein [Chloroflexota bacterium]